MQRWLYGDLRRGTAEFDRWDCPVKACRLTTDGREKHTADLLLLTTLSLGSGYRPTNYNQVSSLISLVMEMVYMPNTGRIH